MSALWRAQATRLHALAVEACWRPGTEPAGGGFHDVIDTGDGRVAVVIGEALGPGSDRARVAQEVLFELKRGFLVTGSLLDTFERLDEVTAAWGRGPVAVASCAVFDGATSMLDIVAAGQAPPLLAGPRQAAYLDVPVGPPIGVAAQRTTCAHQLDQGCTLFLYTSGLLRREGGDEDSAQELLRRSAGTLGPAAAWASELARRITEELGQPEDDATLLSVRPATHPRSAGAPGREVDRRAALRVYYDPEDVRSGGIRSIVEALAAGLRGTMEVDVELIDITASSRQAEIDGVIAAPSVLRLMPTPMIQVVGGVRSVEELAAALDLPLPAKEAY
ncbi:MAG TPA: SpoIIE family protein phosphatase [Acidimicrobiales bacterium]|nr:SpoIIE family protein phosphatase [Acidimicrobiales bacterium]